jgi:REP element-mobilizing transposase RayT
VRRQALCLPAYDYASPGAYFVTICAHQRRSLFLEEPLAAIVRENWGQLPHRFSQVRLDAFVLMPNHLHGVLWILDKAAASANVGAGLAPAQDASLIESSQVNPPPHQATASVAPTLSQVVGAFKSLTSVQWLKWLKANCPSRSGTVWQRNYYERVIRNDDELHRIREYIITNPDRWHYDQDNPSRESSEEHDRAWSWLENA